MKILYKLETDQLIKINSIIPDQLCDLKTRFIIQQLNPTYFQNVSLFFSFFFFVAMCAVSPFYRLGSRSIRNTCFSFGECLQPTSQRNKRYIR